MPHREKAAEVGKKKEEVRRTENAVTICGPLDLGSPELGPQISFLQKARGYFGIVILIIKKQTDPP